MGETHKVTRGKKIVAAAVIAVLLGLQVYIVHLVEAANAAAVAENMGRSAYGELYAGRTGAVRHISLYDVQAINHRFRPMEAEQTGVVSGGDEARELIDVMEANAGLTYQSVQLDDIPLIEVYMDDGQEKPLLLFLHGLGQDKESLLSALSDFAQAGYYAVSMDAYDQGERVSGGVVCDNWAAMLITVQDIDQVVEYYGSVRNVDAESFVLGGFSMGGVETWVYGQLGSYEPAALLPVCGVCELDAWQPDMRRRLCGSWLRQWGDAVVAVYEYQSLAYSRDKYTAIESLNISENMEAFADTPIFCCVGTEDRYFNSEAAGQVIVSLQQAGNGQAVFQAYEGVEHKLTEEMIADSVAFLQGVLA